MALGVLSCYNEVMAMKRVIREGKTLNQRTLDMLEFAEKRLGYSLHVVQGSYNGGGVSASAGTHDGGGAIDVSATSNPTEVVKALRDAGFAAWHRVPSEGPWAEHIHAIAIGDAELSRGAANQVALYKQGRNGLVSNRVDSFYRPSPIQEWPIALQGVNFVAVKAQSLLKKPKANNAVRKVQRALNSRGYGYVLEDGVFGPKTKSALKAFQTKRNLKYKDGRANVDTIKKLVDGYFVFKRIV